MSKGSRNRQQAREKIAKMRALEAKRKRRRNWLVGIGTAVVVVAAAVGITFAVTGGHKASTGSTPHLKLASLSTLGTLRSPGSPGQLGPEGVPVPSGAPLAGLATAAIGKTVDGIGCQSSEQTIFHIHAHLTIFVNGSPRQVPMGIGIPGAQAKNSAQGPFVSQGACFYWLHAHAADGIIHIESPVHRTYTLGNFFDEWGQPLGPDRVGTATGPVVALYNGQRYVGNPRDIPLNAHAQIQLEVGTPLVAPLKITFPQGL
ncbi:MAG TPA: hypothetical protein VGS62_03450 [Streptosporangiaceae bacterium]|nr:hypothetical protein [Streptosporangiaceae bacterium]